MSFKENFSRDEQEDMLEYDDGAFFYFSASLLTFVALPYTYYLLKTLLFGDQHLEEFKGNCQCVHCMALLNAKKREVSRARFSRSTFFRALVGAFLWYIWYLNITHVSSMKPLQSFDPYAILEVPSDATINEIKKKFRKMSLLKHPDKNPDNPLAVQEFIKLTKAYNILTDDVSRENFKKYGNPDGPGSFSVAIAMPKFLLEKENHIQVLLVSFFLLLVVVPGFLYLQFRDDTIKDERGVLLENKQVFARKLNENMLLKNIPQIAAISVEFQQCGARSQAEVDLMKKILRDNDAIKELMPKTVSRNTQNMNLLPLVVILAHMMRVPEIKDPAFRENLSLILKLGPQHVVSMIEIATELIGMHRMNLTPKQIKVRNLRDLIEYSQHFIQGRWFGDDPLLQLPGWTPEVVKNYKKSLRDNQILEGSLFSFCQLGSEKRSQLGLYDGDKAKLDQLEKVVRSLPIVEVKAEALCEGEKSITMTDVVTLRFTVKYSNLPDGQAPGYVHSDVFPFLKRQKWYLIVTDALTKEQVVSFNQFSFKKHKQDKPDEETNEDSNEAIIMIKQRFGKAGKFAFHAFFMCDSYIGFDKEVDLHFSVIEVEQDRVIPEYSTEDLDAVNGPTMMEQMLAGETTKDEDSDPEEDQTEALLKKLKSAGITKDADMVQKQKKDSQKKTAETELAM